ncbi:hypothetical protein ACRRTK_003271 [Alexandromys fortis]
MQSADSRSWASAVKESALDLGTGRSAPAGEGDARGEELSHTPVTTKPSTAFQHRLPLPPFTRVRVRAPGTCGGRPAALAPIPAPACPLRCGYLLPARLLAAALASLRVLGPHPRPHAWNPLAGF